MHFFFSPTPIMQQFFMEDFYARISCWVRIQHMRWSMQIMVVYITKSALIEVTVSYNHVQSLQLIVNINSLPRTNMFCTSPEEWELQWMSRDTGLHKDQVSSGFTAVGFQGWRGSWKCSETSKSSKEKTNTRHRCCCWTAFPTDNDLLETENVLHRWKPPFSGK